MADGERGDVGTRVVELENVLRVLAPRLIALEKRDRAARRTAWIRRFRWAGSVQ